MAFLHADENTAVLVSSGEGQELYSAAQYLALRQFRGMAREHKCRRNFRNTELLSKFAMLFQQANGDISQSEGRAERILTGKP